MKYTTLILTLCIVLCACNESKQDYTNVKTSTVDYANCKIKSLDEIPLDILGEKRFILLDNNNPDCFLSFISKVVTNNNYIFTLDPNLYKIAVFDNKGKAITTIGKRGQGPEEYLSITDFSIDNAGNIFFIDGVLDELFIFDHQFRFRERKKLPFEADILHILDNGNILWGLSSWNEKECKGMKTALTDEHLNIIHSTIQYDEYFDPSYMISWYKFIETEDHLIYNQPIDNNIYLFNKNGELKEIINMNFGDANVPNKYKKEIERNWDEFKNYCLLQHYTVVTENIIAGALKKRQKTIPYIYDRKNNISYEGKGHARTIYSIATGYNNFKWITYLDNTDYNMNLPDSIRNYLNDEGMVLCFQNLK